MFVHTISYKMGRRKVEEILRNNKNNAQVHLVQWSLVKPIWHTDLQEVRISGKDTYVFLKTLT